jgi:hypothetical protein
LSKYFRAVIIICKADIVPCPLLSYAGNIAVAVGFIFHNKRFEKKFCKSFLGPYFRSDLCCVLWLFSLIKDCIVLHFQILILYGEA